MDRETKVINYSEPLPTTNRLKTDTSKLANSEGTAEGKCHYIGVIIRCIRKHWELQSCSDEDQSIPPNEESELGETDKNTTPKEIGMGQVEIN